ncbi:hypothetical protein ABFA25_01090 [Mycobacterium lepromatosis]
MAIPLVAADVGALVAEFVQRPGGGNWLSEQFVFRMAITSTSVHIS